MSTVAEQLRQAREAKNLTVYQVADVTKIRTDHVRALEDGNYEVFSAPVYIRGFVRSYAGLLKLDVPAVMQLLDTELAKSTRHHEHPPLVQRRRTLLDVVMYQLSKVNWRIAIPLLVVGVILLGGIWGYRIWRIHRDRDPLAGLGPGLYQPPKPSDTLAVPPAGKR